MQEVFSDCLFKSATSAVSVSKEASSRQTFVKGSLCGNRRVRLGSPDDDLIILKFRLSHRVGTQDLFGKEKYSPTSNIVGEGTRKTCNPFLWDSRCATYREELRRPDLFSLVSRLRRGGKSDPWMYQGLDLKPY